MFQRPHSKTWCFQKPVSSEPKSRRTTRRPDSSEPKSRRTTHPMICDKTFVTAMRKNAQNNGTKRKHLNNGHCHRPCRDASWGVETWKICKRRDLHWARQLSGHECAPSYDLRRHIVRRVSSPAACSMSARRWRQKEVPHPEVNTFSWMCWSGIGNH